LTLRWWQLLAAVAVTFAVFVGSTPSAAVAREVTIATHFDDAAAYPPLRLDDNRLPSDRTERLEDENALPRVNQLPMETLPWENVAEFQLMPSGLIYASYLAGEKEPRIQGVWLSEKDRGLIWETQVGGRAGLLRYGTTDPISPDGWQIDLEGGAQVRIDPRNESDVEAVDFRVGGLITWRTGSDAFKFGYYHICSHVGDEFLERNPGFIRINYVRDSAIFGWMRNLSNDTQIYGEVAYAIGRSGGAKPLELQYGFQYTPRDVFGFRGAPFFAVNGHTRQDLGWITGFNTVAGWLWRGEQTNHNFRVGLQYYTGPAVQWSFVGQNESLVGGGLWFDY
jgi:hypothetical protein